MTLCSEAALQWKRNKGQGVEGESLTAMDLIGTATVLETETEQMKPPMTENPRGPAIGTESDVQQTVERNVTELNASKARSLKQLQERTIG
mmetsp:Transcript_44944/g.71434  ORF Transcript_44944/g.71434 Transcript_44944/m.71434 type:complete len:91 (-) Transcript_44944:853-1125(-)